MEVMRDTEDGQFGARIVLTAPGKASFTLIAMRHVAEQSFFNIVKKDLDSHDAVLCEGAPGRNLMTRLHRSICTKGLVAQGDGLPWDGQSHWYSADMDPKELRNRLLRALGWRWIPVLAVVLFLVIFGRALWLHKWIDQVPEDEKADRLARLQALLTEQQTAFQEAQVGKTLPVLIEKPGRKDGQMVGRSPYLQAVHLDASQDLTGAIVDVAIVAAGRNSLSGALRQTAHVQR